VLGAGKHDVEVLGAVEQDVLVLGAVEHNVQVLGPPTPRQTTMVNQGVSQCYKDICQYKVLNKKNWEK
jgi:hypothetical protein